MQEIDIDLEGRDSEQSFSDDGGIAYQLMAGLDYRLSSRWVVSAELRHGRLSSVDLDAEGAAGGTLRDLDYNPTTVSIGAKYRF